MNLASLILALKPFLVDPIAHWDAITALLGAHQRLAEYEVARFLVTRATSQHIEKLLGSVDPAERLRGLKMVELTYSRQAAARVLRHMVKDPDSRVSPRARNLVSRLHLDDVALPDTRHDAQWRVGQWNPAGWSFGTIQSRVRTRQTPRPAKPTNRLTLGTLGLPVLATPDDVATLVGAAGVDDLARFTRPGVEAGSGYVEFAIPKATGGLRRIAAPRAPLRKIQRIILDEILAKLPMHDACHGFVTGRSIVTNAAPHQRAAVVVKMDLKDFFPTVHYRRVTGMFSRLGYSDAVADLLAGLCTYRPVLADRRVVWPGVLPQGAPTSPAIANFVSRRLDARIAGVCQRIGAVYTRYADDLTFSFATPPERLGRFFWWIDQICQQEGFAGNDAKRKILRRGNQQRITGVVVNSGLFVPRAARRRFRAILHNCRVHGLESQANGRTDFAAYLQGFAAYVKMVQPALGAELVAEVNALLGLAP